MKSCFIQTSAIASNDFYPIDFNVSANCTLHAAPEFVIPYSYIPAIVTIPCSVPKYVLTLVQIFSLQFLFRYALPMSHVNISKSFKDTSINSILTLSLDTTLDYLSNDCVYVVCPSAIILAFLVNLPSILMSNFM